LINHVLDEVLAEQEGDFDSESRWCVKWFDHSGWAAGLYGEAETMATATNTAISSLERAGVLRARAGKVQLIRPADLAPHWDPAKDIRPLMWLAVLHLSRLLESEGAESAGALMRRVHAVMDISAVKELAYLLYSICDHKNRQGSAQLFNNLVTSWAEIADAARKTASTSAAQPTMDFSDE
jgi:putative DNA methylase